MIGWNISITRQHHFIRRMIPATAKTKKGKFIAAWYADVSGIEWLDKLIDDKKVVCLREGFYPSLYTGKAKDVLPTIQEIPPSVKEKHKWVENKEKGKQILCKNGYDFRKSEDEISSCKPNEWLRIEIWDLS